MCTHLPVIASVGSGLSSFLQGGAERKAIRDAQKAANLATENRNKIKIAKNREQTVNFFKTSDANFGSYVAAVGSKDLNLYKMRSELNQRNLTSLKKAFSSSAGIETYGNLGRKLKNYSFMEAGQEISDQAAAFARGIEQTEANKDALTARYNAGLRTGDPLILETTPPQMSQPSMFGNFLNAGLTGFQTWNSLQPPTNSLKNTGSTGTNMFSKLGSFLKGKK